MPPRPRFQTELQNVPVREFEETCHRIVSLQAYEQANPRRLLYDQGPKFSSSGQRFSPPGDHAGLYVSVERLTAGAEITGSADAWNKSGGNATVVFKVDVKLKAVLDLTDDGVLKSLGITLADVQSAWEGYRNIFKTDPVTWELGCAAFASGRFDGILFPSTKNPPDGRCLLVFTERLVKGSTEVVLFSDEGHVRERLPA